MIASNQPPDRHPTVPPSAPSTSKAESPSHLNDANQPGTRFIQSSDLCRSHFRFKKEEVIALSPSFVAPHLEALPPFPVDDSKATHTAKVSREFLTDVFGGQRFTLFAYMSKCGYTKRPVVYPNWKYNPLLPGASGFPGLVFALLAEFFEQPAFSVFVPVQETPALWSYRGEYRFAISGPLPPEEFNIQTDEVKNTWADMIRNNVLHHVYRELRARVYLRKAHIPINAESVEAESQRIHSRKGGGVTQADILAALSSGEEMISILSMTCIDFDYRFNDLISRKRKSWKSRPTKRW
ncbi:hypothetical protein BJ138DRAFT_1151071 [Hygrophoropsis aurantiaca]|uniref:Uncharacterized protein n=1 Tax=Hygrophoropsis aurantiaca TaxID=72124 RepID=A0ACB8ADV7_9AGAM|nr:hypothetical protein BJ138DRAFT_1151071 [Hygrophoropsis aurantiaca]